MGVGVGAVLFVRDLRAAADKFGVSVQPVSPNVGVSWSPQFQQRL